MGILGRIISVFSSGPAIQNLDSVDMKVDFKDGGVLLPIIVSQHLNNSDEIRDLVSQKLETYLGYLATGELREANYINVELKCIKNPAPEIIELIDSYRFKFESHNAHLIWRS